MSSPKPVAPRTLSRLAARLLIEAPLGTAVTLPRAGWTLENVHVYDAVARELLHEAENGRVRIVRQDDEAGLICHLVFCRVA